MVVTVADGIFKCNKCGAIRKIKIHLNKDEIAFDVDRVLSAKMIHVCSKKDNKYGIMSMTDITLGYDCDLNSVLDNAFLTYIPIKAKNKAALEELSQQIEVTDNEV